MEIEKLNIIKEQLEAAIPKISNNKNKFKNRIIKETQVFFENFKYFN